MAQPMTTRWYHYVFAFMAGGIFINVLPHLLNGVSGRPFPSPFSDPPGVGLSSPAANVVWAVINFLIAAAFVYFAKLNQRHRSICIAYFAGAVSMAFYLANYFGRLGVA